MGEGTQIEIPLNITGYFPTEIHSYRIAAKSKFHRIFERHIRCHFITVSFKYIIKRLNIVLYIPICEYDFVICPSTCNLLAKPCIYLLQSISLGHVPHQLRNPGASSILKEKFLDSVPVADLSILDDNNDFSGCDRDFSHFLYLILVTNEIPSIPFMTL